MPREHTYTAIVIKKQPFSEADEIVTLFTKEIGKVRGLAKATKVMTSKLQYALQPSFEILVTLTSNGTLPKIIRVQPQQAWHGLLESDTRLHMWYIMAEFLLRALPDESPNQSVYEVVHEALAALDQASDMQAQVINTLFQIRALAAIGVGIHTIHKLKQDQSVLFSNAHGGFYQGTALADSLTVQPADYQWFQFLSQRSFSEIREIMPNQKILQLVGSFVEYQLERELKSQRFLS